MITGEIMRLSSDLFCSGLFGGSKVWDRSKFSPSLPQPPYDFPKFPSRTMSSQPQHHQHHIDGVPVYTFGHDDGKIPAVIVIQV